jgi:hypothetical protein
MNERIKELALQAWMTERTEADPVYKKSENTEYLLKSIERYNQKFAELIIRECMNAVCDPRTTYLESMTESSAMYTARERIKKHFGVEK